MKEQKYFAVVDAGSSEVSLYCERVVGHMAKIEMVPLKRYLSKYL